MRSIQPWDLKPALTELRLNTISKAFLEVYYGVQEVLSTEDDCNYGRGALTFSRSRQRLINMALSGDFSWLKIVNPAMDVTLEIEGIPFRFFRDDHESPKKKGFWRRNDSDQLFAADDETPVIFRFIVEKAVQEDDEPEIYFIGYNAQEIPVFEWRYGQFPIMHSVDDVNTNPVKIGPAPVELPRTETEEKDAGDRK
ncbi:hypothetical protein [Collimonas antrihumi]|uniref:hypothetical protein n=1 Tax=Collimonas antrihumi TaxID=1940615 RepID=UPI001B8D92AC|nr:hypothetical protein [Collimonas antrihumi]